MGSVLGNKEEKKKMITSSLPSRPLFLIFFPLKVTAPTICRLQVENKKYGLINLINVHVCDPKKYLCCWNPNGPNEEVGGVVVN